MATTISTETIDTNLTDGKSIVIKGGVYSIDSKVGTYSIYCGITNYVMFPNTYHTLNFLTGGDFTIAFWIKLDTNTGIQQVMGTYADNDAVKHGFNIRTDTGSRNLSVSLSEYTFIGSPFSYSIGMTSGWHHVAITGVNSLLTYYMDGSSVTNINADNASSVDGTRNLFIGDILSEGIGITGRIDDLRFYSRRLSGTEITTLYNLGDVTDGLFLYYGFEEGPTDTKTWLDGLTINTVKSFVPIRISNTTTKLSLLYT